MYAVIKAGGKQQRVKAGDVIEVELVHRGAGETVTFQPILVVDDEGKTHVGKETAKSVVTGKLLGEKKGDKVKVFKYRPKSGYARSQGHRQMYTLVEIQDIGLAPAPKRTSATKASVRKKAADAETPAVAGAPANASEEDVSTSAE
jgi:large subunit ribosomal protein L21